MAILTTSLESDEAELRPCNDVTWFVLDNSLIIFQERQQRLITLDSLSSIVWQLLWGNGTADQNPYMNTIAAAAAELASQSGYTLSTALLFVRSCIEQWSDAKLISRSSQKTAARIILPRHPNPSNVNTIARLGSQFRSYWVSGVTVYVERDPPSSQPSSRSSAMCPARGQIKSLLKSVFGGRAVEFWGTIGGDALPSYAPQKRLWRG
jgi:hypothetical protein